MSVSIVLFTSDLRVHDHPPLRAALRTSSEVVPLFVRDTGIASAGYVASNREAFLADCLGDLDAALRACGGRLVVRSGDVADAVVEASRPRPARTRYTWRAASARTRSGVRSG